MGVTTGIWLPSQYKGERQVTIRVSQLTSDGIVKRSEEKSIESDWIEFLSRQETRIWDLTIWSRVKQEILDAIAGQTQLRKLNLKWGSYTDLAAIGQLTNLTELVLGGAKKVVDLKPIGMLTKLRKLEVSESHGVTDLSPISNLVGLTSLTYGNAYPGSDKTVTIESLDWIVPLVELENVRLPGTSLAGVDLTVFTQLPKLKTLVLPVRARYRDQVFALAKTSKPFRGIVKTYEWLDSHR
jgi:Leucine-rich repeat (LRR) protein